ncbi:MAG: hypothetical protein ABSG90_14455 [Dehalococcoidia bacterium]|jgi:hypothetical protein
MAYDIIFDGQDGRKMAYVTALAQWATIANGTGVITGSPVALVDGINNVVGITGVGTLVITLPAGTGGALTAVSAGATIAGSPVTLVPGVNTITITAVGAGTITVTFTLAATPTIPIQVPGIRVIDAVVTASITGGYKVDPAYATVAGNIVTVKPQYYVNNTGGAGPAANVPKATDLSGQTIALLVIGY